MGHITTPKGIDFFIQSPPLTDSEKKELSLFIKEHKLATKDKLSSDRKIKVKKELIKSE